MLDTSASKLSLGGRMPASEIWTPTLRLRQVNSVRTSHSISVVDGKTTSLMYDAVVIQQLWTNGVGREEWRDIDQIDAASLETKEN